MAIGFVSGSELAMQDEKWTFFKTKFDSLSCVSLVILFVGVMIWADVHASDKFLSWLEQTTTTILGTYLGLAQPWRKTNGGTNGSTSATNGSVPSSTSTKP
jgi:hypothetical protein